MDIWIIRDGEKTGPIHDFIYLASQSPRRRQLLEQWGLRCELLLPDPHEDAEGLEVVRPNEAPASGPERPKLSEPRQA